MNRLSRIDLPRSLHFNAIKIFTNLDKAPNFRGIKYHDSVGEEYLYGGVLSFYLQPRLRSENMSTFRESRRTLRSSDLRYFFPGAAFLSGNKLDGKAVLPS